MKQSLGQDGRMKGKREKMQSNERDETKKWDDQHGTI